MGKEKIYLLCIFISNFAWKSNCSRISLPNMLDLYWILKEDFCKGLALCPFPIGRNADTQAAFFIHILHIPSSGCFDGKLFTRRWIYLRHCQCLVCQHFALNAAGFLYLTDLKFCQYTCSCICCSLWSWANILNWLFSRFQFAIYTDVLIFDTYQYTDKLICNIYRIYQFAIYTAHCKISL